MRNESSRAAAGPSMKWGGTSVGLVLVALLLLSGIGAAVAPSHAEDQMPPFEVLPAADGGLVVSWAPPVVETRLLADGHVAVTVDGYRRGGEAGEPLLPVAAHLVALPPGAVPRLRVLSIDQSLRDLSAPLEVVPWPDEAPVGPDSMVSASAPRPSGHQDAVVFEELGTLRGVRLARLAFYPAIPQGGSLLLTHRLRVALSWDAPSRSVPAASDLLLDQVRDAVLNPDDAVPAPRRHLTVGTEGVRAADAASASAVALLELTERGLYQVSFEDLAGLGFEDANPTALRLFRGSSEVAYQWLGDSDFRFEPGESLIFYADPRFSRWTPVDVYRLEVDTVLGQRMAARSADPTGLLDGTPYLEQLVEENAIYMPDSLRGQLPPGRDGDRWAWRQLARPGQDSAMVPFDLEGVVSSEAAELTLWFNAFTFAAPNPDHRVQVRVNGQFLGYVEWEGATAHGATLSIPAGVLGFSNNLSLRLPGLSGVPEEKCWLDAFLVRYPRSSAGSGDDLIFEGGAAQRAYTVGLADVSGFRAYDVTNPLRPQRLTGVAERGGNRLEIGDPAGGGPRRYVVAGADGVMAPDRIRGLHDIWAFNPGGIPAGADVLIITHPNFEDALDDLVALRQAQGHSVAVSSVLGIYDHWGDGRVDPEAIREFVKNAYDHWEPRPTYVLLVGDGSFDPRQYLASSPATFVPPYLADVDPWAGEAAADNRYVCTDGGDRLPDMMIGRLPVKTLQEARDVVAKVVAYDAQPGGRWNREVVLVADDADPGGDFPALAESHGADHVPPTYQLTRYYCTDGLPASSDCPPARAQEIHDRLLGTWNDGALLFGFVGHASWQQWAVPRYLHLDDLPLFDSDARSPVVLEMTCFTSAFQRPEPTLDEGLVTLAAGGAVATWGGTGLGLTNGHGLLSEGFLEAALVAGVETVGEAAMAGKVHLATAGPSQELLDTFVVLGDPALVINRNAPEEVFLPLVRDGRAKRELFLPLVMRGG